MILVTTNYRPTDVQSYTRTHTSESTRTHALPEEPHKFTDVCNTFHRQTTTVHATFSNILQHSFLKDFQTTFSTYNPMHPKCVFPSIQMQLHVYLRTFGIASPTANEPRIPDWNRSNSNPSIQHTFVQTNIDRKQHTMYKCNYHYLNN